MATVLGNAGGKGNARTPVILAALTFRQPTSRVGWRGPRETIFRAIERHLSTEGQGVSAGQAIESKCVCEIDV